MALIFLVTKLVRLYAAKKGCVVSGDGRCAVCYVFQWDFYTGESEMTSNMEKSMSSINRAARNVFGILIKLGLELEIIIEQLVL